MIMMNPLKAMGCRGTFFGAILAALVLAGCKTGPSAGNDGFAEIPGLTAGGTNAPVASAAVLPASAGTTSSPPGTIGGPILSRSDILSVGDSIKVIFSDLPTPMLPFEERVKEDGTITLLQNQTFKAVGKTRGDLEKEIRTRYVPDFYRNLTVTIQPQERFYFVDGEVKEPNRQIYLGRMTVLKAIASCRGFTDFAKKTEVRIIRADGTTLIVNCKKALKDPRLDLEIFPGDTINVPRGIW
jgi:polysaccharide export outer membrane protein